MLIDVTLIPTFWQRIKFLFCNRVVISGNPSSLKEPLNVEFKYKS